MEIGTQICNGALIAKAEGRIDGANAEDFGRAILSAARSHAGPFIIDCEHLSYISSMGMREVLFVARDMHERNEAFAVCSLSRAITELFEISGFERIIAVHASPKEALSSVGS